MEKYPSEAVVDAWIAIMRAQQAALLKIERAFREARFPTLACYDALWELERAGSDGLRPYQIERQMLISQSNISRLLDKLERNGWVERTLCETDGRGQVIAITEAGRDLRRRMWPVYAGAISKTIGQYVSDEEAGRIACVLGRLTR